MRRGDDSCDGVMDEWHDKEPRADGAGKPMGSQEGDRRHNGRRMR